jgi:hypothetical protein
VVGAAALAAAVGFAVVGAAVGATVVGAAVAGAAVVTPARRTASSRRFSFWHAGIGEQQRLPPICPAGRKTAGCCNKSPRKPQCRHCQLRETS